MSRLTRMCCHLISGREAFLSPRPPYNVHEKPGLISRLLGKISEFESVEMVWWKVASVNTGIDVWKAEVQCGDHWLNSISHE